VHVGPGIPALPVRRARRATALRLTMTNVERKREHCHSTRPATPRGAIGPGTRLVTGRLTAAAHPSTIAEWRRPAPAAPGAESGGDRAPDAGAVAHTRAHRDDGVGSGRAGVHRCGQATDKGSVTQRRVLGPGASSTATGAPRTRPTPRPCPHSARAPGRAGAATRSTSPDAPGSTEATSSSDPDAFRQIAFVAGHRAFTVRERHRRRQHDEGANHGRRRASDQPERRSHFSCSPTRRSAAPPSRPPGRALARSRRITLVRHGAA
jgi:hypothetical protein